MTPEEKLIARFIECHSVSQMMKLIFDEPLLESGSELRYRFDSSFIKQLTNWDALNNLLVYHSEIRTMFKIEEFYHLHNFTKVPEIFTVSEKSENPYLLRHHREEYEKGKLEGYSFMIIEQLPNGDRLLGFTRFVPKE